MGLDMNLTGKYYINSSRRDKVKIEGIDLHGFQLQEIVIHLAYWRKVNAIHKWFVDNVQDGEDECQESYVDRDDLELLIEVCKEVLANKTEAETILPTQRGFFFGGTDYDEWYFEDIENTIKQLEKVLKLPNNWEIYYRASW